MPTTTPMSSDDFRALLVRLRGHGFADWSRSAIERIAAAEGWTIGTGRYPRLTTPPPLLGGGLDPGFREVTDFQELSLTVAEGASAADFRRLAAVGAEVIGHDFPIWGGPGPFVRWREAGEPGTSTEIACSAGRISLVFRATRTYEYHWAKTMEYGDELSDLFPSWMVSARHPSLNRMFYPGGQVATTWEMLEDRLSGLLHDLTTGVAVLEDSMWVGIAPRDDPSRYVRFMIYRDGYLYMEASVECDPARRPDEAGMERLGWPEPLGDEPQNWWKGYPRPSEKDCAAAAKILVDTLRAYGTELVGEDWDGEEHALTYRAGYSTDRPTGGHHLDLFGLRLPR